MNIPFPNKDFKEIHKNLSYMVNDEPCYFVVNTLNTSLKIKANQLAIVKNAIKGKHQVCFKEKPTHNQIVSHWSFDLASKKFTLKNSLYVQDYVISILT